MARKKQSEKNQDLSTIDLNKEAGVTLFQESDYSKVVNKLPTMSPQIDYLLEGGLPFGRMVELYGSKNAGKSTIATHLTKLAQWLGISVVWIDVEGTMDPSRVSQLGVDLEREDHGIFAVQPEVVKGEKQPITVETVAKKMEDLIPALAKMDKPFVIIWDSIAQTPSERELEKGVGSTQPGIKSRALSQFAQEIAPQILNSQVLFIAVNQAREEMGSMFKKVDSPGGEAIKHWASVRLEIKQRSQIKDKTHDAYGTESEQYIGHIMGIRLEKSKVSTPNRSDDVYLMAKNGWDFAENVYRACVAKNNQYKLISSSSAWKKYVALDGTEHKFNSDRKWVEFLNSDEGYPVLRELFGRMMATSFPYGFSPFNNRDIDIKKIPIYDEIGEDYMNKFSPDNQKESKEETQSKEDVDEMVDQV